MAALSLVTSGITEEIYVIKSGDTLSSILKKRFHGEEIYGKNGKLAQVLALNPNIKNPNKIFQNQSIHLTQNLVKTPEIIYEPTREQKREIILKKVLDNWDISTLYGTKFVSITQTGALGSAKVGTIFINNLKFNSEFRFEDWASWIHFDAYNFKYTSTNSSDSRPMYSLDLGLSYKWFMGGIGMEQNPLFRNNAGNIEMAKQTQNYLELGFRNDIEMPTRKPTILKLKSWIKIPLSTASDNSQIELNSISGYGARVQLELNRQILSQENYSLHASWMINLNYQEIAQHVKWDSTSGKINSTVVNASTAIGILFKF